ncbi:MAG: IS630 family transposase, partial [Desulfuromonadales bacterium]|nr:IS630 family transposase [Desulfuromonadales bacterium]
MAGRTPKTELILSDCARKQLELAVVSPGSSPKVVCRAKIVLMCAENCSSGEVARRLGVVPRTVYRWRERFITHGINGLVDTRRPGRPRGKKKSFSPLNVDERRKLQLLADRPKTDQRTALRASIILACDEGLSDLQVAEKIGVSSRTVGKWRWRFTRLRINGLADAPRPGQPRRITDEKVEKVITRTLETQPKDATHWSTRSMAKATGLTQNAVWRIWSAFGLQPHRQGTCKLSTDPFFIEKVRDVVGLYMNPPDQALVLCVDEKSQIQALDRTQPLFPMAPGFPEQRTHDYYRHGTTSLFAALNVATGKVIGKCFRKHRQQEFLRFLKKIEMEVPKGMEIHIVLDNYATHKTQKVKRWLLKRPHFHLHFIPTSSSWLNQVERWFAKITMERIRRGTFNAVPQLENAIMEYIDSHNENPKPFCWTATADIILEKTT